MDSSKFIPLKRYQNRSNTHTHLRIFMGITEGKIACTRDEKNYQILVNAEDVKSYLADNELKAAPRERCKLNDEHYVVNPDEKQIRLMHLSDNNELYVLTTSQGYALVPISNLLNFMHPNTEQIIDTGVIKISKPTPKIQRRHYQSNQTQEILASELEEEHTGAHR
jgi:hypothetical protein